MNPFEYIKQRITDIADVNVAINGRDPSWGYSDLMELLANIEEAYNDRYGSSDVVYRSDACGYTGIEDDYPVSIKAVLDITAETGALTAQERVRKLSRYRKLDNDWIPVEEKSPEGKGEYLVTYNPCFRGNVQTDRKVGIDSFRGKTTWAKNQYQKVIAWQSLPEPYKERRGK